MHPDQRAQRIWGDVLLVTSFGIIFAIYMLLANQLRGGLDFNDETEKVVAAEMIARGGHMYRDVFSQHGPLSFMLAHLSRHVWGGSDVAQYRWLPLLFSCGSVGAILLSPAIIAWRQRVITAGLFLVGLTACQTIWSLMMGMYQVFAGHLFVWALSLLILPLLTGARPVRWAALSGGAALSLAFFAAYSFVISIACLTAAGLIAMTIRSPIQRTAAAVWLRWAAAGAAAAAGVVVLWLFLHGDIAGWFAYHFYLNQVYYRAYMTHGPWLVLSLLIPFYNYHALNVEYEHYGHEMPYNALAFCLLFSALAVSIAVFCRTQLQLFTGKQSFCIFVCLFIGLIYTDPRGATEFQAATLLIVTLGFLPLTAAIIRQQSGPSGELKLTMGLLVIIGMTLVGAQFFGVTHCYFLSPIGYYKQRGVLRQLDSADMNFVRQLVRPGEPIEALPFHPLFYIQSDRWPASGYFYALPWQMDYAAHPVLNRSIDLCGDLARRQPAFIYDDQDAVWGRDPDSYLHCVNMLLTTRYIRTLGAKGGWIRADLVADEPRWQNAAIIPPNGRWENLTDQQNATLNKAATVFAPLQAEPDGACLMAAEAGATLKLGNCHGTTALRVKELGLSSSMLAVLPAETCLEFTEPTSDTASRVRLWPCMDSPTQSFRSLPAFDGYRLQSLRNNLCLSFQNNTVGEADCGTATVWRWNK